MLEFEDHHSPVGWESGGKVELAIRIVADETGMDALAVRRKVAELRCVGWFMVFKVGWTCMNSSVWI